MDDLINIFHEIKIFNNLIMCDVTSTISSRFTERDNRHVAFRRVYSRKYNFRKTLASRSKSGHMCARACVLSS